LDLFNFEVSMFPTSKPAACSGLNSLGSFMAVWFWRQSEKIGWCEIFNQAVVTCRWRWQNSFAAQPTFHSSALKCWSFCWANIRISVESCSAKERMCGNKRQSRLQAIFNDYHSNFSLHRQPSHEREHTNSAGTQ
jgi:hypothetical protein